MRRGLYARRGGGGGRRRRGDTYVARARERVCVRLINQTFAFGCRGTGWGGGRKRSRRREKQAAAEARQGRARGRAGPSKVRLARSLSLCATLGQAPTSVTPTLAHPRRYLPRALFLCRSYAHAPLAPSTDPQQSHSRGVLSPSACLCLSVGWVPLSLPQPLALTLARCLPSHPPPLPLTSRGYVSLARGINTPVGRLRAAKRPKPRSRKRRRLYRVTPRAAFVAPCAASESIVRNLFQPIGPPRHSIPRRSSFDAYSRSLFLSSFR